jgi:hypothetical protein
MRRVLVALTLVASLDAGAARRPFVVAYDTSTLAEGDVEVETWVDFVAPRNEDSQWRWWLGPRWAPFEGVEVAALTALTQGFNNPYTNGPSGAQFWAELLEARWRLFDRPFGAVVLELNVRIPMANDLPWQIAPSLTWTSRFKRVSLTAQLGYAAGLPNSWQRAAMDDTSYHWFTWSGGVAVVAVQGEVAPLLQIALETFGIVAARGLNDLTDLGLAAGPVANLGPTVTVAKGRLWLGVGCLFGLSFASPTPFVRAVFGIVL